MNDAQIWSPVLEYWFGVDQQPNEAVRKLWFNSDKEIDSQIRQKFLVLHSHLTSGNAQFDEANAHERLAAIIVIDQFSRNIYRGSATAFAWDSQAVTWATEGWDKHQFENLTAPEQAFSLLPFVHSEDIELHVRAIQLFDRLIEQKPENSAILTGFRSSAIEHRDIIKRFGRYPHRNEVLNRPSTDEETQYLQMGANRFGQ